MRLSKLAQLAKEDKYIVLVNTADKDGVIVRQHVWIDRGIYPLDGMPLVDKDTLLKVLDVPKDKQNEYFVGEKQMDEKIERMTADNLPDDRDVTVCRIALEVHDKTVMAIYTPAGMRFVDKKCHDVIKDEKGAEWFWRSMGEKTGVLVAKKGYMNIAAVSCDNGWMDEDGLEDLWHIANDARTIFENRKNKVRNQEQLTLDDMHAAAE